jgi:hypothetical protein
MVGTFFRDTILHIINLRSFPQVSWVDTVSDITRVKDLHTWRRPAPTMKEKARDVCPVMQQLPVVSHLKLPIPPLVQTRLPQPAVRWSKLVDLWPKSASNSRRCIGDSFIKKPTPLATESCDVANTWGNMKAYAAWFVGTNEGNRHQMTPLLGRCGMQLGSSEQGRELAGAGRPHLTNTRVYNICS